MLTPNSVFRKTELGMAEVAMRKLGLRAELRRLLIMVDGKNTITKLSTVVRASEIEALIFELQAMNLIDLGDGSAPMASAPVGGGAVTSGNSNDTGAATLATSQPAAAEANAAPTQEQFIAARRAAVRFINDTLGPEGEALAVRLERTQSAQELRDAVTHARASLERMASEATASHFLEAVRSAAQQP
jgi:hypothetical protein